LAGFNPQILIKNFQNFILRLSAYAMLRTLLPFAEFSLLFILDRHRDKTFTSGVENDNGAASCGLTPRRCLGKMKDKKILCCKIPNG